MLSYFLAITVAIVSIGLYVSAFLTPKIHRKDDFLWSGLGLFYALILWVCAARITGAVLLGQLASVSIIVAFLWENRSLRKAIISTTPDDKEVKLEGFSVLDFVLSLLSNLPNLSRKTGASIPTVPKKTKVTPTQEKAKPQDKKQLEKTPKSTKSETKISQPESTVKQPEIETKPQSELIELTETLPVSITTEEVSKEEEKVDQEIAITSEVEDKELTEELTISVTELKTVSELPLEEKLDTPIEEILAKEETSEPEAKTTEITNKKDSEESKKQGFLGKLLGNLTKPFQKKSSPVQPPSKTKENQEIKLDTLENKDNQDSQDSQESSVNTSEVEELLTESETLPLEKEDKKKDFGDKTELKQELEEELLDIIPQVSSSETEVDFEEDLSLELDLNSTTDLDEELNLTEEILTTTEEGKTSEIELELDIEEESKKEIKSDLDLDLDLELELSKEEESNQVESEQKTKELDDLLDLNEEPLESNELSSISEDIPAEDKINLLTDLIGKTTKKQVQVKTEKIEEDLLDLVDEEDKLELKTEEIEKKEDSTPKPKSKKNEETTLGELDSILQSWDEPQIEKPPFEEKK
jgi:hypothetical protein